jgi:hypothetical protein
MLDLLIACPSTRKYISTGARMSRTEWEAATSATLSGSVQCHLCGNAHDWNKDDISVYMSS